MNPFAALAKPIVNRPGSPMGDGVVLLGEKVSRPVSSIAPADEDAPRPKVTASLNALVLRGQDLRHQGIKVIDFYPSRKRN